MTQGCADMTDQHHGQCPENYERPLFLYLLWGKVVLKGYFPDFTSLHSGYGVVVLVALLRGVMLPVPLCGTHSLLPAASGR